LPSQRHVRDELDRADLFILASRTEGLPRAMLEAMARALPCIGTRVGGIPELLDDDDLVDSGDVTGLAGKIREVAGDRARIGRMSARNLEVASGYRAEILNARRKQFFEHIRQVTAEWLERSPVRRELEERP
jgi:glycosyltransferase involved in cell wall biosynthesis